VTDLLWFQVTSSVRVSCEDGRQFIRSVAQCALADPLPAYTGPPLSRMQEKAERKQRKQRRQSLSPFPRSGSRKRISHFVMNLPDSAITFLDAFHGLFKSPELCGLYAEGIMPMVHCHCFSRELQIEKAEIDIRQVCIYVFPDLISS
jgi:tRNA (guanine37-N1)-methyltransferase